MSISGYSRRTAVSICVMFALWPLVLAFGLATYFGMANDPLKWLSAEAPEQQAYHQFRERFGSDDVILISWEECTLDDTRLPTLATDLAEGLETGRFVEHATTGIELIRRLARPPHKIKPALAVHRFSGTFIAPDRNLTCLFLRMTEEADFHRQEALQAIERTVSEHVDIAPTAIHMAGSFVYRAALDQESMRNLGWIAIAACLIALILAWFFLRRFALAMLTLCCGAFSGSCTVVLVGLTGGRMSPVMLVMPTLVFVLATSAAIHLINYYRDATREAVGQDAVRLAVRWAWKPCWYAALTTAIGLVSLGISQVRPVQSFGAYSAIGVIGSLVLMFVVLPGVLMRWPPRQGSSRTPREEVSTGGNLPTSVVFDSLRVSTFVSRYRVGILLGGAVAFVIFAIGLAQVKTSVRVRDVFADRTRIIRDYRWLESRFGPLAPVEVVVRFEDAPLSSMLEQLELVQGLATKIDAMDESGGTISAASFLPRPPSGGSVRQIARRVVFNRLLERDQQMLAETGYFRAEGGQNRWRIRTQVAALGAVAYDRFIAEIETCTAPALQPREGDEEKVAAALGFTGLPLLTQAVQQRLLGDLFRSYLMAFVIISLVISVMQKSVRMGLVAMIPNVFPAVSVFGIMGWLGLPIDIGAMVTASVALGIAVDDTLHFMAWYRHGRRRDQSRRQAVATAYGKCATAMIHTTLICGLALLPHAASSCMPVSRFAWLMLSLLVAALLGDLVLLPAILVGRPGKEAVSPECVVTEG